MTSPKRVLVVVDPTAKEQPAAERGAWLARKMNASLELFVCDSVQFTAGERSFFDAETLKAGREDLLRRQEERLEVMAEPFRKDGLAVTVEAEWGHPLHEGILQHIEAKKPDIVVKDTHYHSAIRRSIFSNTDWHLIRECPVPLLLVKPRELSSRVTIVAAVDPLHERDKPAELDHTILSVAQELCLRTGGEMHVVHAFDPSSAYVMSADSMVFPLAMPINKIVDSLRTQHTEAVDELMADYSVAPENIHVVEGDPHELLASQAEELHADMVVIGAVARGAIRRFVLGSTAEQVLDHIPCDLLIVKPGSDAVATEEDRDSESGRAAGSPG